MLEKLASIEFEDYVSNREYLIKLFPNLKNKKILYLNGSRR